jgi:hypothetical protein
VLTPQMFRDVFAKVRAHLDADEHVVASSKPADT